LAKALIISGACGCLGISFAVEVPSAAVIGVVGFSGVFSAATVARRKQGERSWISDAPLFERVIDFDCSRIDCAAGVQLFQSATTTAVEKLSAAGRAGQDYCFGSFLACS